MLARREPARHAALRSGQHVAEPVRAPGLAGRAGAGIGLVHRVPAELRHPRGRELPERARRPRAVGRVPTDRDQRAAHRAGQAGGRAQRPPPHALDRRALRPHLDGRRPGVRHRGAVPHAVRDRGRVRGHGDRRHRPGPHRQGRGLPAGRDGLRGLPGHLPHGLDQPRRLAPAAGRAGGARQHQPRRRDRGDARALRLHHRPPAAGDLLRARHQGDQLVGHARGQGRRRRVPALGLPALLQGGPAVDQLAGPELLRDAAGDRRRAARARRPRRRRPAPGRERLPRCREVAPRRSPRGRRAIRSPRPPTTSSRA